MERTGAQLVIDALVACGVDTIWGYPGGAIMPMYDALVGSPLQHILTRHEQGAVHAADGYWRSSGRLGVCMATSGPGATNLVTGISTAAMDSSAVLCITGQVPANLIGTDAFQEADVPGIVTAITKQAYQVRTIDELPDALAEAIFVASSGRPGPVVLDIAKNVQMERSTREFKPITQVRGYESHPKLDIERLHNAHDLLRAAERPVCIIGGGVRPSQATPLFRRWAERTQMPVITTLLGLGAADPLSAGWLGMPGMHGHRRCNRAIQECDLLIALGIRFDDRVTGKIAKFAPEARIVHVDIDAAELGKLVKVDAAVLADLADALEAWLHILQREPIEPFTAWRDEAMAIGDGLGPASTPSPGRVAATDLLDYVLSRIEPDTYITTDVGQHQMWAAQRVRPASPRHFVTSGGAGTMGFGVPSAMGVQAAHPEAHVLAIVGDGGFQMTMAEMATIRRCGLPIKILIMDNKYLGLVRQWQEMFFDHRYSAVDLSDNPDFAALARAYDFDAFTLDDPAQIATTVAAWWQSEKPALLHAICELEENVFPMVPAGAGLSETVESF